MKGCVLLLLSNNYSAWLLYPPRLVLGSYEDLAGAELVTLVLREVVGELRTSFCQALGEVDAALVVYYVKVEFLGLLPRCGLLGVRRRAELVRVDFALL